MMSMVMTTTMMLAVTLTFFLSRASRRQLPRKRGAGGTDRPGLRGASASARTKKDDRQRQVHGRQCHAPPLALKGPSAELECAPTLLVARQRQGLALLRARGSVSGNRLLVKRVELSRRRRGSHLDLLLRRGPHCGHVAQRGLPSPVRP